MTLTKIKTVPQNAARIRQDVFITTSDSLSSGSRKQAPRRVLDEVWRVTPESVKVRAFCDPAQDRYMTHSVKFFVAHKKLDYAAWELQLTCELHVLLSYPKDGSSRLYRRRRSQS